ncbi:hypothetical protein THAOC_36031 [Thalassiosira oceanica]|uniref:RING-type domain-containing protein n=1 Tax=Thalassiosira oceanica TaxID=159749 RepID=K0RFJ9_THAOC|nr:hypothetical protein THAOC_36031 [Thalassiosira oceanica]|eukprot:EJK45357.1 hypothetical protein THAOC_36031 [Thalassiosira oceanica]
MSSDELDIEWMASGDRSDPTLQMIDDELVPTLTYDGYQEDVKKLEAAFFEKGADDCWFVTILFRVQQKQKMHEGDRTHPQLLQLDRLKGILDYAGWEEDFSAAEEIHLESGYLLSCNDEDDSFTDACWKLKRRQALSDGDRSDQWLSRLDSLQLSYPGWEDGLQKAMEGYREGRPNCLLDHYIYTLEERQRVFEGDRSSPRLVALDDLKTRLSYPGHEGDVAAIEEEHFTNFWCSASLCEEFSCLLKQVKVKQSEFEGFVDHSLYHPVQRQIIEGHWSFQGWEEEVEKVRLSNYPDTLFPYELERFEICQMFHEGVHARHPALIDLSKLQLSYPGWERDMKECKNYLCRDWYALYQEYFDSLVAGMKSKQKTYDGHLINQQKKTGGKGLNIGECTICWEADRTHVFIPCGHVCACHSCSQRVMASKKKCPFCNQFATMAVELFFP